MQLVSSAGRSNHSTPSPIQATANYTLPFRRGSGTCRLPRGPGSSARLEAIDGRPHPKILNTCSSSTYALRVLRSHGLQPNELHLVARATTVSSILCASPAWYGFANEGDRKRLDHLIARKRCGYLPRDFPCLV